MQKILIALVIAWSQIVTPHCLSNFTLSQLGVGSANSVGKLEPNFAVCGETFARFGSCVDENLFSSLLHERREVFSRGETAKLRHIENNLPFLLEKLVKFAKKAKFWDKIAQTENLSVFAVNLEKLQAELRNSIRSCVKAQSRVSVASYCLLASDAASAFSLAQDFKDANIGENTLLESGKFSKQIKTTKFSPFGKKISNEKQKPILLVKISPEEANQVVEACLPFVYASCLFRKISQLHNPNRLFKNDCPITLNPCFENPLNCVQEQRSLILETFFKPFGNRLADSHEINIANNLPTAFAGSFWKKTKQNLFKTYQQFSALTEKSYQKIKKLFYLVDAGFSFNETLGYKVNSISISAGPKGIAVPDSSQNAGFLPALVGLLFLLMQLFF